MVVDVQYNRGSTNPEKMRLCGHSVIFRAAEYCATDQLYAPLPELQSRRDTSQDVEDERKRLLTDLKKEMKKAVEDEKRFREEVAEEVRKLGFEEKAQEILSGRAILSPFVTALDLHDFASFYY